MNLVTDAPTFPAPKRPRANPWCSRGCHAAFHAIPELNELPAKPTRKASARIAP